MTNHLFSLCLGTFAVVWIITAASKVYRKFRSGHSPNWLSWVGGLLTLLGGATFLASGNLATGTFGVPNKVELPAGYVEHAVADGYGGFVVCLEAFGRVQIYDNSWRFIRGWQVNAEGGSFKVSSDAPGTFEIFTARGRHHYSYKEDGVLTSATTYQGDFTDTPNGQALIVPTPLLLRPFATPFGSWELAVAGMTFWAIGDKWQRRTSHP